MTYTEVRFFAYTQIRKYAGAIYDTKNEIFAKSRNRGGNDPDDLLHRLPRNWTKWYTCRI